MAPFALFCLLAPPIDMRGPKTRALTETDAIRARPDNEDG